MFSGAAGAAKADGCCVSAAVAGGLFVSGVCARLIIGNTPTSEAKKNAKRSLRFILAPEKFCAWRAKERDPRNRLLPNAR